MRNSMQISRRQFSKLLGTLGGGLLLPNQLFASTNKDDKNQVYKTILKTGEKLPVIGLGTSRTFDVTSDSELLKRLQQVIQLFFDMGGGMIDSSPMYGAAQQVLGHLLPNISGKKHLFASSKVWIEGRDAGIAQMETSRQEWGIKQFDLMQIHNLLDWKTHYQTLQQMKQEGLIRYIGITTSHGRSHDKLSEILSKQNFDFVQLSYNIADRLVESRLLPIAQEKGVSVIVNRPFQRGDLFRRIQGKKLPSWASEIGCDSWAQYFLKFVVSHPAVTCVIPATAKIKHMRDNMQAGRGILPTQDQRVEMVKYLDQVLI